MGNCGYTAVVTVARWSLMRLLVCVAFLASVALMPWISRADSTQPFPQDLSMRAWTEQQGLPDDSVNSVLQTRDGYLWVGTAGGLARFDGIKFSVMSPQNWKSNTPICVTALCEDSSGRLWIGTQDNGLLYCEDGVVSFFAHQNRLGSRTVNSIAEDSAGMLWIGTPSGLIGLKGESFKQFTTKDGLPNNFISNVHLARSGTLWITTRGGMCQFLNGKIETVAFQTDSPGRNPESLGVYEDRQGQRWAFGDTYLVNIDDGKHLNHFGSGEGASSRIWSLCEGRNGELWIGASGKGLYCFAGEKFSTPTIDNGELGSDVRAICEDRQGNLWLGTHGGGLVRLQPHSVRVLDASAGVPNRPAVCLAFDSQGRKWIALDRGGLYTGGAGAFEPVPGATFPYFQNLISSLCVGPDSSLWIGTPGAGLYCLRTNRCMRLTTADGLADNHIFALALDSDQAIWIATQAGLQRMVNGLLATFGTEAGLPDQPVTAILPAQGGGLWLGFNNGAVFREIRGQFRQISGASAAAGMTVRALCESSDGRLWVGTAGGRLGCMVENRFLSWDLPAASSDKSIIGIIPADDGGLWISSERAVYSAGQRDLNAWLSGQAPLRPQPVFKSDSVPAATPGYGWPRAVKAPEGRIWFGLDCGMVTINLAGTSVDSSPPPVLIEDVLVNAHPLAYGLIKQAPATAKDHDLPIRLPGERSLEIHFTGIDLSAPERLRFRHRLEGYESDWIVDNDTTRPIPYGALPYGSYTFRVQAGNANQTWFENGASFQFFIPTPIWRTPWALASYVILAVALAGGLARLISARRFRHRLAALAAQQAMERERMRIARDMHDEIGSKLTKISFMSERAKREVAVENPVAQKLDSIAGTSRDLLQTLDEIVWAVNPHNDSLEHVAAYLGQYTTEYLQNTAVESELHIPRGLPHYPLSAETRHNLFLAFEESLNNALKHGRPTRVRVDMQIKPSQFEIRIEDNGCGFDPFQAVSNENGTASGRSRNGLQNMRQRLNMLGGSCDIQSRAGGGTTVVLRVPLGAVVESRSNGSKP